MAEKLTVKKESPEKYQKIIDSAIKVFSKKGFFNAKVADVAKQADVADGTIYLYFKNKDDLLISIFEDSMDFFLSEANAKLTPLSDPKEKLRQFIKLHLDLVSKNQKLASVLQIELRSSHKFMKKYKAEKFFQYLRLVEDLITEGQQKGFYKKALDPHIISRSLFGAIDELALEWVLTKNKRYPIELAANQLFEIFFEGIRQESNRCFEGVAKNQDT